MYNMHFRYKQSLKKYREDKLELLKDLGISITPKERYQLSKRDTEESIDRLIRDIIMSDRL